MDLAKRSSKTLLYLKKLSQRVRKFIQFLLRTLYRVRKGYFKMAWVVANETTIEIRNLPQHTWLLCQRATLIWSYLLKLRVETTLGSRVMSHHFYSHRCQQCYVPSSFIMFTHRKWCQDELLTLRLAACCSVSCLTLDALIKCLSNLSDRPCSLSYA